MNENDAKRWLEYAQKDLGAAHALLKSAEFFSASDLFSGPADCRKIDQGNFGFYRSGVLQNS